MAYIIKIIGCLVVLLLLSGPGRTEDFGKQFKLGEGSLTSEDIIQYERRTEAQIIEEWKKIEERAVMCELYEKQDMAMAKYLRKYLWIESLWKLADKLAVAKRPNRLCQDDEDCRAKMHEVAQDIQVMHRENNKQVHAAYDRIDREIEETEPGFALVREHWRQQRTREIQAEESYLKKKGWGQ